MTNEVSPIFKIRGDPVSLQNIYDKFKKVNPSLVVLITLKDNQQRPTWSNMDKVRKWLCKFSDLFFLVKSPVNGIHFHAIAKIDRNKLRVFKGVHLRIDPVGKSKPKSVGDFNEPYHEAHPMTRHDTRITRLSNEVYLSNSVCTFRSDITIHLKIPYLWRVQIMEVTKEIRLRFGGKKTSLPSRIKAKKYRLMRKLKMNDNIGRVINYLVKNANENLNPVPYDHYYFYQK